MNHSIVFLLLLITITAFKQTHGSHLRSQPESTNNGHSAQTQQPVLSKPLYDTLVSIDERLRLLEAYDNTYKLTRLDFTLEQLSQRIVSIESKLLRLENSFDSKMTKIEEMFVSSDRKSEFKTESIARKVDDLSDRIELKSAHIEIKFESTLNKIVDKLDSIERHIDRTGEEVFEKFSKYDERHTVFESHVKSHIINIESLVKHSLDANTKIKDIVTYDFQSVDNMVQTLKDYKQDHNSVISILSTVAIQLQNYTTLHTLQDTGFRDNNHHKKCDNCGTNSANSPTNGRSLDDNTTAGTDGNDIREVSSTVEQLRQQLAVDEKLTQLDVHVDYYSRKIINTIQE
ncbi:unnamed protein product, partial [Oppiella nova]